MMSTAAMQMELESYSSSQLADRLEEVENRYASLAAQRRSRSLGSLLELGTSKVQKPTTGLSQAAKSKISQTAKKRTKQRQLGDVHIAYRLAGHTIFPIAPHKSGIRFETSYDGQYFEQYYVFVQFDAEDKPVLFKHTLPPFVPVTQLKAYLARGLRPFMVEVSDYLNAFVSRRQQALSVEKKLSARILGKVSSSAACDILSFSFKAVENVDSDDDVNQNVQYIVKLLYEDLKSPIPERCVVRKSEGFADSSLEEHFGRDRKAERILKAGELPGALDRLINHIDST